MPPAKKFARSHVSAVTSLNPDAVPGASGAGGHDSRRGAPAGRRTLTAR